MYRSIARIAGLLTTMAILLFAALPQTVYAMCPLCVAGAAIGLSIARYYGVDDTVTGLWLGALAVSTALWINTIIKNRMRKANMKQMPFQSVIVFVTIAAATIVPFYSAGFFNGMPNMVDTIFGINKLVIGAVIGGIITLIGAPLSNFIKRKRNSMLPYQAIILTLGLLAISLLLLWYVTKYYYIPV